MKKVTEANFTVKSVKVLSKGVVIKASLTQSIGNENTTSTGEWVNKDVPHPDFEKAMKSLLPIVVYDEGSGKETDYQIKGVSFKNDHTVKIHHMKEIESGSTSRSSGWISFDNEDFEKADDLKAACDKIRHEAYEYFINNKRAQLSLGLAS